MLLLARAVGTVLTVEVYLHRVVVVVRIRDDIYNNSINRVSQ